MTPLRRYGKRALLWKNLVKLECLLRNRKWPEAVDLYNKTVRRFRESDILEPLGLTIMRIMGEFKELAPRLEVYISSLSAAHYQWYVYLAEAYRNIREWSKARKVLREGLKRSMPEDVYHLELAKLYMKRRYWRSALRTLSRLNDTRNPAIAMERDAYKAMVLSHRRRVEDAFSLLERYSTVYDPKIFWAFAELYCMSDDVEQAVKFYDSALSFGKRNGYTPWELSEIAASKASCLYDQKRHNAAFKAAVAALAFTPLQYEASLILARIYARAGDKSRAVSYYSSVIRACPTHPEAVCRLGLLLGSRNETGVAYLKLCVSLRDAPRKLRRRARRLLP